MTTTTVLVVLLVGGTLLALLGLAIALVLATDRLRATVDRLVAVRAAVEPALEQVRTEADRARAHADRLRTARLRAPDIAGSRSHDEGVSYTRSDSGTDST